MRLTIEGSLEELQEKRGQLLKALATEFQSIDPELSEIFQKAVPAKEPQLKYKVLRQLQQLSRNGYQAQLEKMVDDIMAVLETEPVKGQKQKAKPAEKLTKTQIPEIGTSVVIVPDENDPFFKRCVEVFVPETENLEYQKGLFGEAEEKEERDPGEEPPDPDYDEESGEPIIDPETGMSPSEMQEAKEQGTLEEEEEEEEGEKSFRLWPEGMRPVIMSHGEACCGSSDNYHSCDCGTLEREDIALSKARRATPIGGTTPGGYTVKLIGGKRVYVKETKSGKQLEYPEKVLLKDGRVAKLLLSDKFPGTYRVYDKGRFTGYVADWLVIKGEMAEKQPGPKRTPVSKEQLGLFPETVEEQAAQHKPNAPPKQDNPPPKDEAERVTREASDQALREGLVVEGFAHAGSPAAFELFGPHEGMNCTRCGANIANVFATSKGPMGGDCLATLTGDDSTRRVVKVIHEKLARIKRWHSVEKIVGFEIKPALGVSGGYWLSARYRTPESRIEEYSGELVGTKTELLGTFKAPHLTMIAAMVEQMAEEESADFKMQKSQNAGLDDQSTEQAEVFLEVMDPTPGQTPKRYPVCDGPGTSELVQKGTPGAQNPIVSVPKREPISGTVLAQSALRDGDNVSKAGPFIGPRGGKWADPEHTIPWKETGALRTGAISIPEKTIRELTDKLLEASEQNPKTEQFTRVEPAWTTAKLKDAKGDEREIKLFLTTGYPAAKEDPRGVSGNQQSSVRSIGDDLELEQTIRIGIAGATADYDLPQKIRDVLSHELTHALDPSLTASTLRNARQRVKAANEQSAKDKRESAKEGKSYADYLNQKSEVTASLQQIVRDLTTKDLVSTLQEEHANYQQDKDFPPPMSPKQMLDWYSPRWDIVNEHYSEENKKRVYKAVAQLRDAILSGRVEPIQKALEADEPIEEFLEKAGPFIGPRGGKWKDAAHTIPWEEPKQKTPSKQIKVNVHPAIDGRGGHSETFRIVSQTENTVKLSRHKDSDWGPTMPKASVKHFVNDLSGKVDLPLSGNKDIDAVLSGKAKLLGKGDDGLAFKVGNQVVKVSTTVPFQPENPGHRTPQQASDMLRKQVEIGNLLADKGIKGVQRSEFVQHGDKGFQVKEWVEIPEKLTREQLDKIQETVHSIHEAGYAIRDTIQAGLNAKGEPVMFDVGKAAPKSDATGIHSDEASDIDNLKMLYRDHGETFVNTRQSEAQKLWDHAMEMRLREKRPPAKFINHMFQRAADKLKEEAKATLSGKALTEKLEDIDSELEFFHVEESAEKAEGLSDPLEYDHTKPIADKEQKAYTEIQRELIKRGAAKPSDFEIDGPLYGRSNNELISWLESLKANNGGE